MKSLWKRLTAPKPPHNPDAFGCVKWIGDQRGGHFDDVCPTCGPWKPERP